MKIVHLVAGVGSKTMAVVFNFDFDVVGGALLTFPQALKMITDQM